MHLVVQSDALILNLPLLLLILTNNLMVVLLTLLI